MQSFIIITQCAHLMTHGLSMCFYFLFDLVKDQLTRLFSPSTIINWYTESTIDYLLHFYRGSLFSFLPLIFCVFFFSPQKNRTTPPLSCTDCEKCTYHKNLVHPRIFCMERNYLCEESISNLIEYLVILKMRLNTVNVKISAEKYYSSVSLE